MSASVSVDPSKCKEILTIENIIANLSTLLARLSIPQSSSITNEFELLRRDFDLIEKSFKTLDKFEDYARGPIKILENSLDDISKVVREAPNDSSIVDEVKPKLIALRKDAMKLKMKFPLWLQKWPSTSSDFHRDSSPLNGSNTDSEVDDLLVSKFRSSSFCRVFQDVFKDLDITLKLCCLSFAVLPANVVVKRRLLINLWVGEGSVDPPADDIADEILTKLEAKGFIDPVKESHKLFKMQPYLHHLVIKLAEEAQLLDYDSNGNPTIKSSLCNRACLVNAEEGTSEQELAPNLDNLEDLHTIFNVNEPFPDLRFECSAKKVKLNIVEWFSKMKNLNVLYLGRWQSPDQHHIEGQSSDKPDVVRLTSHKNHIEVESTEFLKGLKNMKCLRLLSLQGISRIDELPNSIGKLTNLRILDLKACHNLEALPDGIASLKKLLYLDISGCYLLDDMPKGLASLSELRVLKGFLTGNLDSKNSCTLEDLVGLKNLSKFSINTRSTDFPTKEELKALGKLEALRKLAIVWGVKKQENDVPTSEGAVNSVNNGAANPTGAPSGVKSESINRRDGLPTKLEKLELQCLPHTGVPDWLIPGRLGSLKKLYIRGGKLNNLSSDGWKVEILRLKYLNEFNMNWNELQTSFPELRLLEKVNCNITSCPCDEEFDEFGVWRKR
uniref:Disease resistance R13L4/SHOC-2-like LRR domain-containing protein n=1 Tax=Fagus sylvatica TaxID=28930 RepID=A0A2N9FVK4_FAGSY